MRNFLKVAWKERGILRDFLLILQTIAVIISFFIIHLQVEDFHNNQADIGFKYIQNIDQELRTGTNFQIAVAIERKNPLLKKNGGSFTEDDFDIFLAVYNRLSEIYDRDLISPDLLYGEFSYGIILAHENPEIQDYLRKIRIDDSDYFYGLDELYEDVK
ncbi:MAG: hypothetical protein K8Q97_01460 [Candidatus Andersenbacteria bacterium]|nr:hypothetical protein [Candidatus Andersenbacteria bacterium]